MAPRACDVEIYLLRLSFETLTLGQASQLVDINFETL